MSPRALHDKLRAPLAAWSGQPAVRPHLGLHELEVIVAKDRLETVRVSRDLGDRAAAAADALRAAAERTEAAW